MTNEEELEAARRIVDGWHLGQTSSHYESGGRGAGTISTGAGDHGGVSYGTYQLSSKMGTVQEFLQKSAFKERFAGLAPATDAFNAQWRALAKTEPAFAIAQHEFIRNEHFAPQNKKLESRGIDLANRGRAVQDALWSTAVQFRNGTPNIFAKGLEEQFGKDYKLAALADRDIIEAVQNYKVRHNETLFKSSSAKVRQGTLRRGHDEKAALLRLAEAEYTVAHNGEASPWTPKPHASTKDTVSALQQGDKGKSVSDLQLKLARLGCAAPDGQSLQVDGHFGPKTRDALKAFQRAQNLKDDGKAGPATMKAIEARLAALQAQPTAEACAPNPLQMTDPAHPGNALFKQAQAGIQSIDAKFGHLSDQQAANAAAAIAVEAHGAGLTRIDVMDVTVKGERIIAAQGQWGTVQSRVVDVPAAQALHTPLAKSSQAFVDARSGLG
ncbi:MAG: peptidoglycan-binding protein [Variovorax sp.]|nr:MAG: peptidoglycan-binding protein [Variovorax sp.]